MKFKLRLLRYYELNVYSSKRKRYLDDQIKIVYDIPTIIILVYDIPTIIILVVCYFM